MLRYVKFRPGDVLDVEDPEIELVRYRLLGTGFFATVQLSLRKGEKRGGAVLVIDMVERNTLILQNLFLGIILLLAVFLDRYRGVITARWRLARE